MPSSASESIPYLIEFVRKNRPNLSTVLDVGVGFGKDGFLLREYYEAKEHHRYQPKDWKLKITGVEIFEPYISDLQRSIYTEIIIGDVFAVLAKLGKFELAILGDVIEHLPKEDGFKLIHELFNHVEDIIIVTPKGLKEHSDEDNPYEEHKSGWDLKDFKEFTIIDEAIVKRLMKPEEVLVVYLGK